MTIERRGERRRRHVGGGGMRSEWCYGDKRRKRSGERPPYPLCSLRGEGFLL